mmetsp:Transcript_24030/g.69127  ORF Transcript_24030/g.69127 Transcript_24030/m.69127 type:complete len:278 (-) Transcript_24030:405-1238(-)
MEIASRAVAEPWLDGAEGGGIGSIGGGVQKPHQGPESLLAVQQQFGVLGWRDGRPLAGEIRGQGRHPRRRSRLWQDGDNNRTYRCQERDTVAADPEFRRGTFFPCKGDIDPLPEQSDQPVGTGDRKVRRQWDFQVVGHPHSDPVEGDDGRIHLRRRHRALLVPLAVQPGVSGSLALPLRRCLGGRSRRRTKLTGVWLCELLQCMRAASGLLRAAPPAAILCISAGGPRRAPAPHRPLHQAPEEDEMAQWIARRGDRPARRGAPVPGVGAVLVEPTGV